MKTTPYLSRTALAWLPLLAAAALLLAVTGRAAGPTSELFLTDDPTTAGSARLLGIQGANVIFNVPQSPTSQHQSPIAVNSTVRTLGFGAGSSFVGAEYTLAGVPTGATYPFPAVLGSEEIDDGTTDGTFNYAWGVTTGTAYQFSLTWTNPVVLFTLGTASGSRLGITYDPSNNSLWIAGLNGAVRTLISDYSLTGTLLSSFNIIEPIGGTLALALDPADGTLWRVKPLSSTLTLEQYARSAPGSFGVTETPLNTQAYAGIQNGAFGGEFRYTGTVVPEPSTWALLLGGLGSLLGFRRLRRSSAWVESQA